MVYHDVNYRCRYASFWLTDVTLSPGSTSEHAQPRAAPPPNSPKNVIGRVRAFLSEAQSIRRTLVYPRFRDVFKLTIFAIIFMFICMVMVTALDNICYKLVTAPLLKRAATAKA